MNYPHHGAGRSGGDGVASGRRVIAPRPNVASTIVKPTTDDEKELAADVTASARSEFPNYPWDRLLVVATCRYNKQVLSNISEASMPNGNPRNLLGTTTPNFLGQFWIDASKYASGPIRDAAFRLGIRDEGGGAAGHAGRSRVSGSSGITAGNRGRGGRSVQHGRGRGDGGASTPSYRVAGAAGPGEVVVLTDSEIDGLSGLMLKRTLRSMGVGAASNASADVLKIKLKRAVRDGKRRKLDA